MLNLCPNLLRIWLMRLRCLCKNMGAVCAPIDLNSKERKMKKIAILLAMVSLVGFIAGCSCKCENEPIVESNHKLIVPPNFGNMPK